MDSIEDELSQAAERLRIATSHKHCEYSYIYHRLGSGWLRWGEGAVAEGCAGAGSGD